MSNTRKSSSAKLVRDMKRFDKLTQGYEQRIARQREAIDRLVAAHTIQASALHDVEHEVKTIKDARKIAASTAEQVKVILAVTDEEAP